MGSIIGGGAKEGKEMKRRLLSGIPSLGRLLTKVQKFSERGWLPGLDNRKIYVRSFEGRVLTHTSLNTLLQSDGAIVAKKTMVLAYNEIKKLELLANQVIYYHDEIQYEAHMDCAEQVGEILVSSMQQAGLFYNMKIPIDGEYKVGKHWGDTH